MRKFIQWAYTPLLVLLCFPGHGQTDTLATRYLDEVVISGSRTPEKIKDIPRSIDVIGQDQIANSVYNSVGDLLSKQSGLYLVGANQTPGTNQALFMRGAASNQVVVMIDGVRITDPSSPNNAIDLSELSLALVDRIEILKGSNSTLFGSGAIGGVVNIITKTGHSEGLHGSASLMGGSFGSSSSSFSQQGDISYGLGNGIYFNGSVFNQNTQGLNAALDTTSNRQFAPDLDDFRKTDGNFKMGIKKSDFDAFISYRSVFQDVDIDQGAFSDDDNNRLEFYRSFWTYGGSYQLAPQFRLKLLGSNSVLGRTNTNDSSLVSTNVYDHNFFRSRYNGEHSTYEGQLELSRTRTQVIIGGGSYSESMDFNTYFYSSAFGGFESSVNYDTLEIKSQLSYIFGQLRWSVDDASKFVIATGARFNSHSKFGSYLTYELNPSLELTDNMSLYTSFSTGFNAPSLYQLYDPTPGTTFTRGNVNLKPEESRSLELGVKATFAGKSFLTASLFSTRTTNAIEYVYLWNNTNAIPDLGFLDYAGDTYVNVASQRVHGAELNGTVIFGKWNLSGNITVLNGTLDSNPADLSRDYSQNYHLQLFSNGSFLDSEVEVKNLARRPRVTSNLNLQYQFNDRFNVRLTHRLAGSRIDSFYDPSLGPFGAQGALSINSYSLFDIGAAYRVNDWFRLTMQIDNIFDTDYQEINGFATRGRSGYLKAIFRW